MKKFLKRIAFSNCLFYDMMYGLKKLFSSFHYCKVINKSHYALIKKDVNGKNNTIIIGKDAIIHKAIIFIRDNNNMIYIGNNVRIGPNCSFWMKGNNIKINVGDASTFSRNVHINA